jgi:HD-like signal output (HDOD) protein
MKRRRDFSSTEVEQLHRRLEPRLRPLGLATQPKVAGRLLELMQRPDASAKDFADAIRVDWALAGRMLKLANSAFYAQRSPVTTLERATVVLGLDRTKAIALGFHLSSFAGGSSDDRTRAIWGQSVYRAVLASQLARAMCPQLTGEAFLVGLLLDVGQPLALRLLGKPYQLLLDEATSPGKLFALEVDRLEFTHVDVFAVLANSWALPRLLARPILWHHTLPPASAFSDPAAMLHRLAYLAGSIQIGSEEVSTTAAALSPVAEQVIALKPEQLRAICASASAEYQCIIAAFDHVADRVPDVAALTDHVRSQLVELLDEQMARAIRLETRGGTERVTVAGSVVEIEPGRGNDVAAYISTDTGQRLLSCTVNPNAEGPEAIARLLGLEDAPPAEIADLVRIMRSIAA